jgi:formylglycine-generating enzyme required for sulfatase activity
MKNNKSKFLAFLLLSLAWVSVLSAQTLRNLSYSQRPGTKLIDIQYDLVVGSGSSAQIDFFFSFDNGQTYPIPCVSLAGDAGPFVVGGNDKKVVWDAGKDWNQNFTSTGKIKVRSTLAEKAEAIDFDVATIPFRASGVEESPSWFIKDSFTHPLSVAGARLNGVTLKVPKKFSADKYEVTNYQWNKVVEWAQTRGYDLQLVPYLPGEENLPRTNIRMAEVVKWLNARSEMEGLTPVFYVDPIEQGFDMNGDGRLSAGPDSNYLTWEEEMDLWSPSFDWTLIANHDQGMMQNQGWIDWDPNMNGQWDSGEPFVDRNRDGKFQPQEFEDFNGNGKRDKGQSIVCRTGDISSWYADYGRSAASPNMMFGWHLFMHAKHSANGYMLPDARRWNCGNDLFRYLAMGGRTEQGSYQTWEDWNQPGTHDPLTGEWIQPMKTGIRYVEEWPWGQDSPIDKPDVGDYAVVPYGPNPATDIQSVGGRKPNGYGLHDMIGNVAELTMEWYSYPTYGDPHMDYTDMMGMGGNHSTCHAVGGSFMGLPSDMGFMGPMDPWGAPFIEEPISPQSVMGQGTEFPDGGSPEVGFRAIRIHF